MSTNDWIAVAIAIAGGLIGGIVLSRIVAMLLGNPRRPRPLQDAAKPLASLAFSFGVVVGLVVALGIMAPDAVDQLTNDAVGFIPKALTAIIIVIFANVVSSFASAALGTALARASVGVQKQAMTITRTAILVMAVLLAVGTLGIDTTVVNMGVGAIFFATAAAFALLVGLGGRPVASEVASTRAVRRLLVAGDRLVLGTGDDEIAGRVVAVHPTSVELDVPSGRLMVPSSRLLAETFHIDRSGSEPAES